MPSKQRPRITHSQNLGSSGTQDELPPAPSLAAPLRPVPWPALVFLAGVIAFEAWYMAPSLFRSWYFSSDEYVMVAEVIRFLHLDFRQHFFDMPGTPLMALTALIWLVVYGAAAATGLGPAGMEHFTFDHLPLLFAIMRGETLFFALLSILLVFLLALKITNWAGACVAALILMMSPIYSSYTSFIRVESISMCLILASVLCLLRGLQSLKEEPWILLAGLLAGLAAACRFHSITASLPLLLLLLFTDPRPLPVYSPWLKPAWKYTLLFGLVAACGVAFAIQAGYLPGSRWGRILTSIWAKAFEALYPLALLGAAVCAALLMLHRIPKLQWFAARLQHPRMLLLAAGCCAGCLIGTPTMLWKPGYFFQSINSYSAAYFDLDRANWPFLQNVVWYLKFYGQLIAPDYLGMALMATGAILILIKRDRLLLPFLISALLFFVSKPIKLVAAPHHVILWLPFYGILAGYAVARAWEAFPTRIPYTGYVKHAALVILLVGLGLVMVPGPKNAAAATRFTEGRLQNVGLATEWLHKNTEPASVIAISYFCFNSDVFFTWLRSLEVPVPAYASDSRQYRIWWGDHSALQGQKGYVCAAPADLRAIKHTVDLRLPGEGTDPFADKGFHLLKSFGTGPDEMDLFTFNFAD